MAFTRLIIREVVSTDLSVGVTDPFGPIVDLSASGGGIKFATDNEGTWLFVGTSGSGGPEGVAYGVDATNGNILIQSLVTGRVLVFAVDDLALKGDGVSVNGLGGDITLQAARLISSALASINLNASGNVQLKTTGALGTLELLTEGGGGIIIETEAGGDINIETLAANIINVHSAGALTLSGDTSASLSSLGETDVSGASVKIGQSSADTPITVGRRNTDSLGFFGHAPHVRPGAPVTLGDVIAALQNLGLTA